MGPLRHRLLARIRALPAWRQDLAAAILIWVEGAIELVAGRGSAAETALGMALLLPLAAALALRRRLPIAAVVAAFATLAVTEQLHVFDKSVGPFLAVIFLVYSAGRHTYGRRSWAALVAAVVSAAVAVGLDPTSEGLSDFVFTALIIIGSPFLAGRTLRDRARLTEALAAKARRADAERAAHAEQAAVDERTRVAGELHDVVAHALSAMTVQAAAARRLAERDAVRAEQAFAAVERTGREALDELRALLGVLRREDEDLALAPQPSLAHLATLVRRARAAGLPVAVDVQGAARSPLGAGVDLTAYRVIQEALGSAHDAGQATSASVAVRYADDEVEVEVNDDGTRLSGRRRRLLGMRERVALYGGELETLPAEGGGYRVRARLPLARASA